MTDVCFESFGIECISQEVLNKIKDISITHNIFTIQEMTLCEHFIASSKVYACWKKFVR